MIFDLLRPRASVTTSAALAEYLVSGGQSASGKSVTPDSAMRVATVFACVRVLAESVGQLPLHLYERRDREQRKATEHPLYSVLRIAPNSYQTPQEFLEWLVACLALRGNAYAQIIRVRGRVAELFPLHPAAVTPELRDGEVRYRVQLDGGGAEVMAASDVLHVKLLPLDGLVGASPIRYAREAIGLAMATEEHGSRLFSNGARPGGVLEHPGKLSDAAYRRLKESWEERHQGVSNAHRVAILEEGAKWQSIGMSSEDAQFLETRKYQRSEICGIFRVPPHLIGDLERATFSNIEHQGLDFVVHALMPYLTRIEQRIRIQLLRPEERTRYFAKFNVAGLLRGDMAARASFYSQMLQNGALSPNEIRELEDMNPREGGDVYLTPMNMHAVDDAGRPVHAPAEDGQQ